jgi:hypothetical protein
VGARRRFVVAGGRGTGGGGAHAGGRAAVVQPHRHLAELILGLGLRTSHCVVLVGHTSSRAATVEPSRDVLSTS